MRHPARRSQRALGTAFAGLLALVVLGLAAPAAAQVTVDPGEAEQGSAARLNFRITNESPTATITKVEFRMPADLPIPEVYPISVEDWAPQINTRTLDKPIQGGLHGTDPLTVVTDTITYSAMPEAGVRPGGSVDLALSLGGLPRVAQLVIGVVQTNSDGTEVKYTAAPGAVPAAGERPAVVVKLKPAPPGSGQHAGAGQGQHEDTAATADADRGSGYGRSALWGALAAVLAVGALFGVTYLRQRVQDRQDRHVETVENLADEDSDKENESESEDAVETTAESSETVTAR